MEELQARHRKEAKELQGSITGRKKQATKKTRKGVNDECERLEAEMRARHAAEIAALDGSSAEAPAEAEEEDLTAGTENLSLEPNGTSTPTNAPAEAASPSAASEPQARKPNRARARMERRKQEQEALMAAAADEASSLPDLKATERETMVSYFRSHGLAEREIRADGHCLYSAFADQMDFLGQPIQKQKEMEGYRIVRHAAGDYMLQNSGDFEPFLEEDLQSYVGKVKDTGEWGGQLELMALARRYGVKINVLQGDGRVEHIGEGDKEAWMAYYRHGFGLGEHYNSLRKV